MSAVTAKSPEDAKKSGDCRNGFHHFCSGKRWIGHDGKGCDEYARCQCDCHKSGSL